MSSVARRYFVRATELMRRGDHEQARDEFRAALELAPMYVEARVSYAHAIARGGDGARAAQLVRAGLGRPGLRDPERLLLLRALGDVLIASGTAADYRAAEEAYNDGARLGEAIGQPQIDLHDRLARLRAKPGRFAEAIEELLAAARTTR